MSAFFGVPTTRADEGLWLVNQPPLEMLKQRHGFEPTPEWMEHQQKSAVHIGASGSFVSADGLVLTNHHVAMGSIERLSTAERNLVRDGFYARTRADELKCPGVEAEVLWSIEDVTQRINAATAGASSPADAARLRRAAMTQIEDESKSATGLSSDVVTLDHGARYHLYRYKRFDDVRLVFAPESGIASFGGDVDNFEYPRHALDISILRVYENGQPVHPEHFLKWSRGVSDGELVFAFGHPGRTDRFLTVDHLKFWRDTAIPAQLRFSHWCETRLSVFASRSDENARVITGALLGTQNWRKAITGNYEALLGPAVLPAAEENEAALRRWVAADSERSAKWGDAWERIAAAQRVHAGVYLKKRLLEDWYRWDSVLLTQAMRLVRLADELPKPSDERLREFRDSELDSQNLDLAADEPVYDAREIEQLTTWLTFAAQLYGGDDPFIVKLLNGQSPRERIASLVAGTTLKDVAQRRKLASGGRAALDAAHDPMIEFARLLDPEARRLRAIVENEVDGVEHTEYARINAARLAMHGATDYPDATGTLRMSVGVVQGYREDGHDVPAFTTLGGLYARSAARHERPPFELPPRWSERRDRLDLATPMDFVSTADIIGGNSGSPMVNRAGELVGVVFDGNLQSLAWDYAFEEVQGRALAVDARVIIEALRKVYDADALAKELLGE